MASFIVKQGRTHLLDHKIRKFLQSSFLSHKGVAQLISGLAYEPALPFEVDQVDELLATMKGSLLPSTQKYSLFCSACLTMFSNHHVAPLPFILKLYTLVLRKDTSIFSDSNGLYSIKPAPVMALSHL